MKLPLKPSLMKVRHQKAKWIILHHTVCKYPAPGAKIDNLKFQTTALTKNVLTQKTPDINFHYVIEKVKDDYHVISARPFVYECDYPDIDSVKNRLAIHVSVMGDYNLKIPETRLYEIAAYRLINPLLKQFNIAPNRVIAHHEVSDDEELTCPGDFFDMDRLVTQIRRFIVK